MGATEFAITWTGTDYKQGFRELRDQATFEYGNDPYNGTISTTGLCGRPHKVADRYTKTAEKKAQAYIEKVDYGEKRKTHVIDLGVCGYEVARFVKVPHTSADAQFQTRYVAYADERELGTYKTAAEARAALEKAIALPRNASVSYFHVEKKTVKVSGKSTTTCAYERQVRVMKSAPKTTPKGATVTPIHKFVFYGLAGS